MRSTSFTIPVALRTTSSLKSLSVSRWRRGSVERVIAALRPATGTELDCVNTLS